MLSGGFIDIGCGVTAMSAPLVVLPVHELRTILVDAVREFRCSGLCAARAAPPPRVERAAQLEPTFSTREVAQHLQCKESTISCYCRTGKLAGQLVSRRWVVSRSALDAFLAKKNAPSSEEPDAAAQRVLARLNKRGR